MIKNTLFILFFSLFWMISVQAKEKQFIPSFTLAWYYPSYSRIVSETDFKIAVNFWFKEFEQHIEIKHTNIRIFNNINKMKNAFNKGELTLVIAPPMLIVKHFDLTMLADGFTGSSITGKPYSMVLLAKKNKGINEISDFKHKRLVLAEHDELARIFLDTLLIPKFDKTYKHVFKSVELQKKPNSIIHSLFFDNADIGVSYLETFDLMSELNPQIRERIKILSSFPITSPTFGFFHKKLPKYQRQFFIEKILEFNHSIRSQQILKTFKMTSLSACTVEALDPFIRLYEKYNKIIFQSP